MLMFIRKKKGQGATEYAIFIAAVLAGLIAMQVYYQRSVKGNMRSRADSIGEQYDNEGTYNANSSSFSFRAANATAGASHSEVSDTGNNVGDLADALVGLKVGGETVIATKTAATEGEGSASTSSDTLTTSNKQGSVWTDTGS